MLPAALPTLCAGGVTAACESEYVYIQCRCCDLYIVVLHIYAYVQAPTSNVSCVCGGAESVFSRHSSPSLALSTLLRLDSTLFYVHAAVEKSTSTSHIAHIVRVGRLDKHGRIARQKRPVGEEERGENAHALLLLLLCWCYKYIAGWWCCLFVCPSCLSLVSVAVSCSPPPPTNPRSSSLTVCPGNQIAGHAGRVVGNEPGGARCWDGPKCHADDRQLASSPNFFADKYMFLRLRRKQRKETGSMRRVVVPSSRAIAQDPLHRLCYSERESAPYGCHVLR